MANKLSKKNTKVQKVIKKTKPVKATPSQVANKTNVAVSAPTGEYVEGIGRRKVATARVRIYKTAGDFLVNGKAAGQYFAPIFNSQVRYNQPFELTNTKGTFAVSAKVTGSGINAQLEAVIHGLARALVKFNPDFKSTLRAQGLLTRDDRMKETRKVGMGGKARRQRQSPRR
jgi:small subunit ribosomal protein S9